MRIKTNIQRTKNKNTKRTTKHLKDRLNMSNTNTDICYLSGYPDVGAARGGVLYIYIYIFLYNVYLHVYTYIHIFMYMYIAVLHLEHSYPGRVPHPALGRCLRYIYIYI